MFFCSVIWLYQVEIPNGEENASGWYGVGTLLSPGTTRVQFKIVSILTGFFIHSNYLIAKLGTKYKASHLIFFPFPVCL